MQYLHDRIEYSNMTTPVGKFYHLYLHVGSIITILLDSAMDFEYLNK